MTEPFITPAGPPDPDLEPIAVCLDAVRELLQQIGDEVGPGTMRGADAVIERHRAEVYTAMEVVGLAVHTLLRSDPAPDRVAAAQALLIDKLREFSLTSPIVQYGEQQKRRRLSYFEVVEHVRAGMAAGADTAARVLDDYYVHTRIGQGFANRLALLSVRLVDEVERCQATGVRPTSIVSLQYVGGAELAPLARDPDRVTNLRVTCIDSSAVAARHAEQTLRPLFNTHIQVLMADPLTWLHGPAYTSDTACMVYDVSSLEQFTPKRVIRVLEGVYRVLRTNGIFLLGSTAGNVPVAERMIRDWLLGWDWKYRSEAEWRELFAQTPFGAESLAFEYEPLGINALIRATKTG